MIQLDFIDLPNDWEDLRKYASEWLDRTIAEEGFRSAQLVYRFLSDDGLLEVNQTHLNHDYYTDVITFDYSRGSRLKADVFISEERIRDHAQELNSSVRDERDRVFVHAVLHLCGYGDKTESEALKMRELESKYLHLRP